MWDEAKVVLKEKFIDLNVYIRKICSVLIINCKIWEKSNKVNPDIMEKIKIKKC